jgi:hemoglobin/transferrin/lactoferrin receptor protein
MNKPSQEKILSTVVIAIIAICQALNAEETAKSIEVLVTATREKNIFDTPYSVSVVDRNYLVENQIRTTPEVLQEVTGPMVQKTSFGHGSPYIRGLTGFRNLFLIDGIRLNNSCFREGPNQYWNTIDNLLIERMEILKGSSSVLYGSDALGGTVAVFTPEPDMTKERYSASKVFSRYSYAENSVVTRVEQEGKLERLGFILGGTSKKFGDIIAGKDTGRLPNTGYEEWDADFKAIYQINEKDKLIFAYQKTVQDDVPRTHRTIKL